MPDPLICSVTSRDDGVSFDPAGAPPAPPPAAPPATDSCYACADAVPLPEGGAVRFLVESHQPGAYSVVHGEDGPFSLDLAEGRLESNDRNAAIGVATVAVRTDVGSVQVEASGPSAGAEAGFDNLDGSHGYHAGAHASVAHGEANVELAPGWSLTFGGGVGIEAEASGGIRDADHDGREELCFRAEVEGLIGACFEPADLADAAIAVGQAAERAAESLVNALDASAAR